MEEQPCIMCSREIQRTAVANAAFQGHFFLLRPKHVPPEELVAPPSCPSTPDMVWTSVCVCHPAGRLQKPQHAKDPAQPCSAFLWARLLLWGPGLLGVQDSMPDLQCSLAGWLPQAAGRHWLSSQLLVPSKVFVLTRALAGLPQLRESPAGCDLCPPPSFPSSTASLQFLQPPGLGDFVGWHHDLSKSATRRGREGIKQEHGAGWRKGCQHDRTSHIPPCWKCSPACAKSLLKP